jgi:hypothetical protein
LLAGCFQNNDNMQSSPTAYEKYRDERIKRNQLRMQELGLSQAVNTVTAINGKGQKQVQQQRKQSSNPTQPRRTSGRLNATKQPQTGEGPSDRLDTLESDDEDVDLDYNAEERDCSESSDGESSDGSSDGDKDDKTSHQEDITIGEAEGNLGTTLEDQGQEKSGGEATPGRY